MINFVLAGLLSAKPARRVPSEEFDRRSPILIPPEELHRLTKGIGIVYLFRYLQRKGKK
jgi:hypothetical protein